MKNKSQKIVLILTILMLISSIAGLILSIYTNEITRFNFVMAHVNNLLLTVYLALIGLVFYKVNMIIEEDENNEHQNTD